MKFIKYTIFTIVALVAIFVFLGIVKPEISYTAEVIVNKPASEAMAVAGDVEKMKEWLPGFQKIEHISGTPGEVGAVSKVYCINEGQEMVIKETITEFVPGKSMKMKFEESFMNMDYEMICIPMNRKTKMISKTDAKGNGIFAKSMMVLISGMIEKQEVNNLKNLKETIESNTKVYE